MKKKGYFFSMDAIAAVSILLTGIFLIFYVYTTQPIETPTYYLSEDILNVLSTTSIDNLTVDDYPYFYKLITDDIIKKTDNTILEQIGELNYSFNDDPFDEDENKQRAGALVQNITNNIIPDSSGFSFKVYRGNEEITLYTKQSILGTTPNEAKVRIGTRKIIFGTIHDTNTNQKMLWGPYVVEAITWR